LVLVLNYHNLKGDRGLGQLELLKIIEDLFGSCDNALHHASSIILVVSHVPLFTDLGLKMELEDVKEEFASSALSPIKAELLANLLDRACIFHPTNRGGESWITAGPLSERIKAATPISDPANVFKIVLSISDEAKLRAWMEALSKRFHVALSVSDNGSAAKALSDMMRLNILDHFVVAKLFDKAKTDVSHALQRRIDEAQTRHGNFEDAAASVAASRAILEAFNSSQAARDMLDLVRFSLRIDAIEASIDDRRTEKARVDGAIAKANKAEAGKAAAEAKLKKVAKKHREETSQAEAKQAVAEAGKAAAEAKLKKVAKKLYEETGQEKAKRAEAEAGKAAVVAKAVQAAKQAAKEMAAFEAKATEVAKKQNEKIRQAGAKLAEAEAKCAHAEAGKAAAEAKAAANESSFQDSATTVVSAALGVPAAAGAAGFAVDLAVAYEVGAGVASIAAVGAAGAAVVATFTVVSVVVGAAAYALN
jgi:hypothetical protein